MSLTQIKNKWATLEIWAKSSIIFGLAGLIFVSGFFKCVYLFDICPDSLSQLLYLLSPSVIALDLFGVNLPFIVYILASCLINIVIFSVVGFGVGKILKRYTKN